MPQPMTCLHNTETYSTTRRMTLDERNKMKELNEIAWNVSEDEYRADPALSYSALSRFDREGFDGLGKLFERQDTPSLIFGSIVDALITGGMEEYERRFIVLQDFGISDTLRIIVRNLYDTYKDYYKELTDIPDQIVSEVAVNCGYYTDPKYYKVRVKKVKECYPYYAVLKDAEGKTPISKQQYEDAMECVRILKTSPTTERYFSDGTDTFKPYYQLKFKGEYNGIPLRCMADLIWVDYDNKVIYPFDLKTSGHPEWEFHRSFLAWNYSIQARLYYELIRQTIEKDDYFKDFTIADYQFIVISNATRIPLVWEFKDTKTDTLEIGEYYIPDWKKLAVELKEYLDERPRVPKGIFLDKPNDIAEHLKEILK